VIKRLEANPDALVLHGIETPLSLLELQSKLLFSPEK